MKTIYYLAISIPKSMASVSSGEKCCSLKLPGVRQAEKRALERLKPRWRRSFKHAPGLLPDTCLLLAGPAWRQRAANPGWAIPGLVLGKPGGRLALEWVIIWAFVGSFSCACQTDVACAMLPDGSGWKQGSELRGKLLAPRNLCYPGRQPALAVLHAAKRKSMKGLV